MINFMTQYKIDNNPYFKSQHNHNHTLIEEPVLFKCAKGFFAYAEYEKAEKCLLNLIRLETKYVNGHYLLAVVYNALHKTDEYKTKLNDISSLELNRAHLYYTPMPIYEPHKHLPYNEELVGHSYEYP
jgi:hypothetical protein